MCTNVACCADVTVTEPLLDLLQAHAIGIEQTGAAMAQVVEADALHSRTSSGWHLPSFPQPRTQCAAFPSVLQTSSTHSPY